VPPHVVNRLGVAATCSPAGNVSVKPTPSCATVLAGGLVSVSVRLVEPFNGIIGAPNALAMDGGATTYMVAEAARPGPPSFEAMMLVTLFLVPAVTPTTNNLMKHPLAAGTVPPDKLTIPVPGVATMVPPHSLSSSLFEATTTPVGRVSVKARPESWDVEFWFPIKNSNGTVVLSGMLGGPSSPRGRTDGFRVLAAGPSFSNPNDLEKTGGDTTVRLAFEVLPVPPVMEVTATLLFSTPGEVPVTLTDNIHVAPIASVPADKLTEVPPGAAAGVPPHVLVNPLVVETTSPAGRVSVKATPARGMVFAAGLVMVNVSDVAVFSGMLADPNAAAMVGGAATARLAVAVWPVPPLADETAPVVLMRAPAAVPVTFTVSVQELPGLMEPPDRLTPTGYSPTLGSPPQVFCRPGDSGTCNPFGKASLKATPVSGWVLAGGLVRVNVRVVWPFNGIDGAPKALAINGGAMT